MKSDVAHEVRITYRDSLGSTVSHDFEVLNTSYTSTDLGNPNNRKYIFYRHKKTGVIYSLDSGCLKVQQAPDGAEIPVPDGTEFYLSELI